jgi:hypothetical protein
MGTDLARPALAQPFHELGSFGLATGVSEPAEEPVCLPEAAEERAPGQAEHPVGPELELLELHAQVPGDQLGSSLIEDVVKGLRARTLGRAEPSKHFSVVQEEEPLSCSVIAGKEKLERLLSGEHVKLVET